MSVVLYVHNGEPFLGEALDAILTQTHSNFELCVIDDGSTDGTSVRLAELARSDDRVQVQHQEARGRQRLHETVNAGLAMTRHELIAMANADDVWHPTKLARQVDAFAVDPQLDVCTHDAVFIDDRGRVRHGGFRRYASPFPSAPPRPWQFLAGNPIPNPTTMFRRGILRRIGLQEVGDMHDHQFWFKATVYGCRFLGLPDRLIRYRVHEASHSTATGRRSIIEQTRRECATAMASRFGLDRLVPELALAGDDRSRAWAASFVASEFWAADAPETAETYWRMARRSSDDSAVVAGLGMCRLRAGESAGAAELLRAAATVGSREARYLLASPDEVEHVLAPIWDGPEPAVVDIVRATDLDGLELGADSCPPPFDHVAAVAADSTSDPEGWLTEWFAQVSGDDVRVQLVLDDAVDLRVVETAHAAALERVPSLAMTHIEVDVVPAAAHAPIVAAHELDGIDVYGPIYSAAGQAA